MFDSQAFKANRLQVQEVGSQLIVALCRPPAGWQRTRVLDLCAGAGGKTLALADLVGRDGMVFAWDKSRGRLDEARRRVRRFNLVNVRFPHEPPYGEAGVILIDAPCSGSGVLAREPDLKWKITAESVEKQTSVQRELLHLAARAAAPGTVLVYATCSLLRGEGEAVVQRVLTEEPGLLLEPADRFVDPRFTSGPYLKLFPHKHPGGGFFAARLIRRER